MGCASSSDAATQPATPTAGAAPSTRQCASAHPDPELARATVTYAVDVDLSPNEIAEHQRLADEWSIDSDGEFTDEPSLLALEARAKHVAFQARRKHGINDDVNQFPAEPMPPVYMAKSTALAEAWLEELEEEASLEEEVNVVCIEGSEALRLVLPPFDLPKPVLPLDTPASEMVATGLPNSVSPGNSVSEPRDAPRDTMGAPILLHTPLSCFAPLSVNDDCNGILTPLMALRASRSHLTRTTLLCHEKLLEVDPKRRRGAKADRRSPTTHKTC